MKKKIVILLGVFIGFLSLFYGINISQKSSIYISGPEIKNLINIWEDQTGRPPVKKEIDMIIDNLIKEEILYHEALKLGLDQNDKIIKRRLIQKLEFYKESENLNKVKEENIIEYYNENISSYILNKRYFGVTQRDVAASSMQTGDDESTSLSEPLTSTIKLMYPIQQESLSFSRARQRYFGQNLEFSWNSRCVPGISGKPLELTLGF